MNHLPKINIALGALVTVCFFLPWVSVECGGVTIVQASGFQITAGKIPLDDSFREKFSESEQNGLDQNDFNSSSGVTQQASPQIYLVLVLVCAILVIYYSFRAIDDIERTKTIAVLAFGSVGLLLMMLSTVMDFGMDIPTESELILKTTYQFGYYGVVIGYTAIVILCAIALKSIGGEKDLELPTVDLPIELRMSAQMNEIEPLNVSKPRRDESPFGDPQHSAQTSRTTISHPPGTKVCRSCGTAVGLYQAKCMKCGNKLKPG